MGPEVTLGRDPPADPGLVAAARLMAAPEEGTLQGRSLAQLGDLGMPLAKDAEARLSCCSLPCTVRFAASAPVAGLVCQALGPAWAKASPSQPSRPHLQPPC